MTRAFGALTIAAWLVTVPPVAAQVEPDSMLVAEIASIRAIDNHAHPTPVLRDGEKDTESDVPDSIPATAVPVRLRQTNPEYLEAWRELYGYSHADTSDEHLRELIAAKRQAMREHGDDYPAWVLDHLGIDTMFANRFAPGRGLAAPRFTSVWQANPLLFPLNNELAKKSNPQREADFTTDERWLKAFLSELGATRLPGSLDGYLTTVVVPLLERRKREQVAAVKFYAAYMRSLDFADVPEADAARVYAKYAGGGPPEPAEYKALQDFLFRRIARECGRLGLAVHIHVGVGAGPWFYNSGASPFLLDSVLNDPALRATKFVLIHGGLPFAQATRFLLGRPNVYADFSSQAFLTSSRELSDVIRAWLQHFPEKVLFGTDAYPLSAVVGWEEIGWISTRTARQALALALTGMMADGLITRARASELARMVLRDNAIDLYRLRSQ